MAFTPNIELLPVKKGKRAALKIAGLVLITTSTVLLVYPFLGQFEYLAQRVRLPHTPTVVAAVQTNTPTQASKLPQLTQQAQTALKKAATYYVAYAYAAQKPAVAAEAKKTAVAKPVSKPVSQPTAKPVTKPAKIITPNRLVIPSINVDMTIVEGKDEKALLKGAWHIPGTPGPNIGGNMVLGGHRWLYKPPSTKTFYNLDKVKVGDAITVVWEGKTYNYLVAETKVVDPKQVEILHNTTDDTLTLFTCTPLFSTKNRLVVIAKKI